MEHVRITSPTVFLVRVAVGAMMRGTKRRTEEKEKSYVDLESEKLNLCLR